LKEKVKNITNIQTGLFTKHFGNGDVLYLQSKHFDEHGQISETLHPELNMTDISAKHILNDGDILFSAKGTKNFASVYHINLGPAVASTSFFVIRLTTSSIIPEYLAWYINTPKVIADLKSKAIGSSIPSISKQVLENLDIIFPDIAKQNLILKLNKLKLKEKMLSQEIKKHRDTMFQHKIMNAINK
jgi:restriction endonuclease S subunit